jgi:hypothetical protein
MPCECSQLPDIVNLDDHPAIGRFDELETGDWVRLVRCPSCQQLWSVDEWDKYQTQFAVRIPQREGWREFDTTPFRRQYLVQARGGLTPERCIWQGCEQRRVQGVVYCANHLYQTGARE